MAANQKIIYVYDDFSFDEPILLGLLYITFIRGKENFSFEYDHQWLVRTMFPVDLDPEIPGFAGRHYPGGKGIFGIFSDAISAFPAVPVALSHFLAIKAQKRYIQILIANPFRPVMILLL